MNLGLTIRLNRLYWVVVAPEDPQPLSVGSLAKMVLGFRRGLGLNELQTEDADFESLIEKLPTKILVRLPDRFESLSLIESRVKFGLIERKVVSPEERLTKLLEEHRREERTLRRDAPGKPELEDWSNRTVENIKKPQNRPYQELEDYNKSLELDNETLRAEVQSLHAQNQKLKKTKRSAESQLMGVQGDLNKLHSDFEVMKNESMKTLAHEREKSAVLLQQFEELERTSNQFRNQLDERDAEINQLREELTFEKNSNEELRSQNSEFQTRV